MKKRLTRVTLNNVSLSLGSLDPLFGNPLVSEQSGWNLSKFERTTLFRNTQQEGGRDYSDLPLKSSFSMLHLISIIFPQLTWCLKHPSLLNRWQSVVFMCENDSKYFNIFKTLEKFWICPWWQECIQHSRYTLGIIFLIKI